MYDSPSQFRVEWVVSNVIRTVIIFLGTHAKIEDTGIAPRNIIRMCAILAPIHS